MVGIVFLTLVPRMGEVMALIGGDDLDDIKHAVSTVSKAFDEGTWRWMTFVWLCFSQLFALACEWFLICQEM